MKNLTPYLLIVGLVILFMVRECRSPVNDPPLSDTTYLTKVIPGDSILFEIERFYPAPYPVYKDTGSTKWLEKDIDTLAILQDYFCHYYYSDTIQKDSSFLAIINDSVSENRIVYRQFLLQNLRETSINTTIITPPPKQKPEFYFGIGAGGSYTSFDLSGNLLLTIPKKRMAFSGSYGLMSRQVMVTAYFKFKW